MDETMAAVKAAAKDVNGLRSRVSLAPQPRPFPLPWFRVLRNQPGLSSSGRQLATSRYCFPENQSPSTAEWRKRPRRCKYVIRPTPHPKRIPPRPPQPQQHLWPQLSPTMNPSLLAATRAPFQLPKRWLPRRTRSIAIHTKSRNIPSKRHRVQRHQPRSIGTANSAARNWRVPLLPVLPAMLARLRKKLSRKKKNGFHLDRSIQLAQFLRFMSRQPPFLPLQELWKKKPSTRKKRTPSAMKNRRMKATTNSRKRLGLPVSLPRSVKR